MPAAVFRAFVSKTALKSKAAPSTGTGSGEDSYFIYGIYVKSTDGNFTVSGGSVTGKGTGEDSHGIHINGGSMTVEGGTVTSSGEGYYSSGIYIDDNGRMTVKTARSPAPATAKIATASTWTTSR